MDTIITTFDLTSTAISSPPITNERELLSVVTPYAKPEILKSLWQIVNTFIPFFGIIYLMYLSLATTYWVTFGLSMVAALFFVRIFIMQHDAGHYAFFKSNTWNDRFGYFCSLFTMIPYYYWRRQHALHHAGNGNLDRRGHGDMDVYTVDEYLALTKSQKIYYRLYRNPIVFLLFGPLSLFFYINRTCTDPKVYSARDKRNIWMTNLTILATFGGIGYLIGYGAFLKIAVPIYFISSSFGIWLFYIQHQFEHTYWRPNDEWSFVRAAMQGSSLYKLPKILQWFTGNIGFHHIHHLKPGIPNYKLEKCYRENPAFHDVFEVTLWSSLKTMFLSVWDPKQERLISFRELKKLYT